MNTKKNNIILSICVLMLLFCVFNLYKMFKSYTKTSIVLNGNDTVVINVDENYKDEGALAYTKNNKENITNKIKIKNEVNTKIPGKYKVYYIINEKKLAERNVIVKDNIAPVITLNGSENLVVGLNSTYQDEGATATDNCDGDITKNIIVTGEVDTTKIGDYKIEYTVKDKEGNTDTKTKVVSVKENSTYVKVSIEEQKIYLYKDNKLLLTSNIVTGTQGVHDTPKGTFKVYEKARNVYLKGRDYVSYVNYWMAIKGGVGLHDATWRDEFKSDMYISNGSHGCINLPLDIAKTIYETVSVGTVVEVY